MEEMRLQKFIANSGVCSRRKAEEYILAGKVKVNGKIVTELGTKVDPQKDEVIFNNKKIEQNNEYEYILLNKPNGFEYFSITKVETQGFTIFSKKNIRSGHMDSSKRLLFLSILSANSGDFDTIVFESNISLNTGRHRYL